MQTSNSEKKQYEWVDNIKFACCLLVVYGHFSSSMLASGIASDSIIHTIFIQTVYTFHVPAFFVCSGFLYQKSNRVHNLKSYGKNILQKIVALGVPYFTFELITLVIKIIFADDVNVPAGDILETLFISPMAPYWYLYALFFMFVFIPCMNTKKQGVMLLVGSFGFKIFGIICSYCGINLPYIISSMAGRMIWFSFGMCIALDVFDFKTISSKIIMTVSGITAVILSVYFYRKENSDKTLLFSVGVLFVLMIVIMAQNYQIPSLNKMSFKFRDYFMPVYVMHTIFAAGVRILLLKLGVTNIIIHVVCGLSASVLCPVLVYEIARKIPPLLFFIYPQHAINIAKSKRNTNKSQNQHI